MPRGSFQSRGQCLFFEECESKAYPKKLRENRAARRKQISSKTSVPHKRAARSCRSQGDVRAEPHWRVDTSFQRWCLCNYGARSLAQIETLKPDVLELAVLVHNDPGRTRTCNLWFRRPTPYPLGHRARCMLSWKKCRAK